MSLSITAGRFKGAVLRTPSGRDLTRPTSGKVRQALFNILAAETEDADFLDLYAGSGAVGLEALSRGCRATLVESHAVAFRALEANCRLLLSRGAEPESLRWLREDALKFCESAASQRRTFRLVFADPPFSRDFSGLWKRMEPLVAEGGAGVVQFPRRNPPEFTAAAARIYDYGESGLAVFRPGHC